MKLEKYLVYDENKKQLSWMNEVNKSMELGKIIACDYNRETNSIDVVIRINHKNIDKVKDLLKIKE